LRDGKSMSQAIDRSSNMKIARSTARSVGALPKAVPSAPTHSIGG
jgi:hypothetical protein